MENKKLILNIVASIVSYLSTIVISFFLTPYIIGELGADLYSFYTIGNNIVSYVAIFSTALSTMAARYITISIVQNRKKDVNEYYSSILMADVILAVILSIPFGLIVIFAHLIFDIPIGAVVVVKVLLALIFVTTLMNICATVTTVATFAMNRVELRTMAEICKNLIRLFLYIVLFSVFKPSIIYVGIVTMLVDGSFICFNIIFTKKLLPNLKINIVLFNWLKVKEVLFSGVWNSINQLGLSLLYGSDLIIGNILLGSVASGYLAIAHTIPNFSQGIINSITNVFMPRITRVYATDSVEELVAEIKLSQKILGIITNIPICVFMVIASEFFELWMPGYNSYFLKILSILTILHQLLVGVVFPISNLNTTMNQLRKPAIIMLFLGIINVCSMIMLIKGTNMGIYAVPITTLVLSIFWFGVFIPVYPCKKLNIPWWTFYPEIVRTLSVASVLILICELVRGHFLIHNWLEIILYCIFMGIVGLILNIFTSFRISSLYAAIKTLKSQKGAQNE